MDNDEIRVDPTDGLPATPVGEWVTDKHGLLKLYIEISRGVRSKFVGPRNAGATFIDLFCASGRSFIRGTDNFVDGSPLVAWRTSMECRAPFTAIHINDSSADLLAAAETRLKGIGAPVIAYGGAAELVAEILVRRLNPHALHFALIDPYKLWLPFPMLTTLATMKRMDLLIHVSAMDLQRNWGRYSSTPDSPLHSMAPNWHKYVRLDQPEEAARLAFIHYWIDLLKQLGFEGDVRFELIKGSKGQPLYWLVLVAKHEIALSFWKKGNAVQKDRGYVLNPTGLSHDFSQQH